MEIEAEVRTAFQIVHMDKDEARACWLYKATLHERPLISTDTMQRTVWKLEDLPGMKERDFCKVVMSTSLEKEKVGYE